MQDLKLLWEGFKPAAIARMTCWGLFSSPPGTDGHSTEPTFTWGCLDPLSHLPAGVCSANPQCPGNSAHLSPALEGTEMPLPAVTAASPTVQAAPCMLPAPPCLSAFGKLEPHHVSFYLPLFSSYQRP